MNRVVTSSFGIGNGFFGPTFIPNRHDSSAYRSWTAPWVPHSFPTGIKSSANSRSTVATMPLTPDSFVVGMDRRRRVQSPESRLLVDGQRTVRDLDQDATALK